VVEVAFTEGMRCYEGDAVMLNVETVGKCRRPLQECITVRVLTNLVTLPCITWWPRGARCS
jgi:hypothetical protein